MGMYTRCVITLTLKPSTPRQVRDWLWCMVQREDELWAAYHALNPENKYGEAEVLLNSRRGQDMFANYWGAKDAHSTLQDLRLSVVSYFTHYDNEILKFVGCISPWVDQTQPWSISSLYEGHCSTLDVDDLEPGEREHILNYMLIQPLALGTDHAHATTAPLLLHSDSGQDSGQP